MREMKGQLQALQGAMTWKSVDLDELCLAPEIPIPSKFKVPEFTKYDGSGDPHYHLKTYCTRMSVWSRDEKFLIHFFHESLTGAALQWFMNLDHSKLRKWSDLTDLFMRNYQFNLNTAPTREQLKGLKRRTGETFKEYAQRWRATASQVQPPLVESELCSYFIGTLGEPYFKIMLGTHVKYFTDLIEVGERIDVSVREGKLENTPLDNKKGPGIRKKEGDVSHIPEPYQYPYKRPYAPQYRYPHANPYNGTSTQPPPYQPRAPFAQPFRHPQPVVQMPPSHQANSLPQNRDSRAVRPPRDERPLPNFNVTRSELFKDLVEKKLMGPRPTKQWQPPFPAWYNSNENCEYHMGVEGHSIDRCDAFRRHVLGLLDNNYISIRKDNNPNIVSNPLPEHDKMKQVNVIEEDVTQLKDLDALGFTMREVFEYLKGAGYTQEYTGGFREVASHGPYFCKYHRRSVDHDIEGCASFRESVRKMMVFGVLRVERSGPRDSSVCMMKRQQNSTAIDKAKGSFLVVNSPQPNIAQQESGGGNRSKGSLLVVNKLTQVAKCDKEPLAVIHVPAPFPYHSNHEVPWNYGLKIECPSNQEEASKKDIMEVDDHDLVSGITRSGRIYSKENTKPVGNSWEEGEGSGLKEVSTNDKKIDEAEEFLKVMKHSEYDIVEQLKKTPARISILSLILNSEAHRKALQKVLEEAYVRPDITPEKVGHMVNMVRNATQISFSEDEIFPTREGRPKALHITLKCQGYIIAKVLIDGGSALNILPLSTLKELPVDMSALEHSDLIVRAFDGTKREVMGDIRLSLEIGPSVFEVEFQVMNVDAAYTMLLGRPWIHTAGAVPSTLHQRIKYLEKGKLITIKGEEELMISKPSAVPYIENAEQTSGNFYQSFEVQGDQGKDVNQVVAKIMKNNGFEEGKGLGVALQGMKEPIEVHENLGRQGLGYQLSIERLMAQQMRLRRGGTRGRMEIPHIRASFPFPSEIINPSSSIVAVQEGEEERGAGSSSTWIQLNASGEALDNWESEIIPDIMSLE